MLIIGTPSEYFCRNIKDTVMKKSTKYESTVKDAKTIAECLGSISFNEIEEILWDAYGMGDNFTPFLKMTYDRVCNL